ncbi:hypothetical protein [Nocardia barduliensis]|uniref:hypothetical protein n=1 Tax=Nocardia barduliensis TaxID=2736643 RepID=UPI0015729F8C|nr:hypothetical protein [Nocardia barduliensis]
MSSDESGLRAVYLGQAAISCTGYVSTIALTYVLIARAPSYETVGVALAACAAATFCGTLLAPRAVRTFGALHTLQYTALGGALCQMAAWWSFANDLMLAGVAASAVSCAALAPTAPAAASQIKAVVSSAEIRSAIGKLRTVRNVAIVAGLLAGSLAMRVSSPLALLWVDAAFKAAAFAVYCVGTRVRSTTAGGPRPQQTGTIPQGLALLAQTRWLLLSAALEVFFQLCWGAAIQINGPAVYQSLGQAEIWLIIAAAPLVGAALAGVYTARASVAPRLVPALVVSGAAAALPLAIAAGTPIVVCLALGVLGGAVLENLSVAWVAATGMVLDRADFTALFSAQVALGLATAPVSRMFGGLLLGMTSPQISTAVLGLGVLTIPALALMSRPLARNDKEIVRRWKDEHAAETAG